MITKLVILNDNEGSCLQILFGLRLLNTYPIAGYFTLFSMTSKSLF